MNEQDNDQKLALLRGRYEADRSDTKAATELAQFCADLGWHNEAIELYRELIERLPDDFALQLDYGNLCFRRENHDEAVKVFRRLTELRPDRVEGWNNLGIVYLACKDETRAREAFERILDIEPDNAGALLNIGNCHFDRNDFAEAEKAFAKAVAVAPDFADGWFNLGNAQRELGQHDTAIKSYKRALRYRPDFPSALKNLGYACELKGDAHQAEEYYRKALESNRADASLYRNLAVLCTRQDRTDEAREYFLQAVKLAPRDISGWLGLRHLSLVKGDLNSYVRATAAVISKLSGDDIAFTCATLREVGHHEEVDRVLSEADAVDKHSDALDAERLLAYFRRQGRTGKVAALEKKLLSLSKPGDSVLAALARYAFENRQIERAGELTARIKVRSVAAEQLSWDIALAQGQTAMVVGAIKDFLVDNEEFGDGWLLLGSLLAREGDLGGAREALLKALEMGFSNAESIDREPAFRELYESLHAR